MEKTEWFKRKFSTFDDTGLLPPIIERLDGTAVRLQRRLQGLDEHLAEQKANGKWSIKEEVGHLGDLEPLWLGRVQDLVNGQEELSEADLTNQKTHTANHNASSLPALLTAFEVSRIELVSTASGLSEEVLSRTALHPRLKTPMRIIDLAFFVAEHDDHHLAQISWLIDNGSSD